METRNCPSCPQQDGIELPPLIQVISSSDIFGFDENDNFNECVQSTALQSPSLSSLGGMEMSDVRSRNDLLDSTSVQNVNDVSISMPPTPILRNAKKVTFSGNIPNSPHSGISGSTRISETPRTERREVTFHSHAVSNFSGLIEADNSNTSTPRSNKLKDRRFDSFKTWSGKLERQLTNLRGRSQREPEPEDNDAWSGNNDSMPVDRYYDALQGPELETLRDSEEIVLPEDKTWPFLLRFQISSFGICLGVSSQAVMWKNLASSDATKFLHISLIVSAVLWSISIALVLIVSSIYLLKVIFYFEAVRREYYHPIRVNFFFAPWIALLFLAQGAPTSLAKHIPDALWYVLMVPIFLLELKIYGQWMSGGQRRLSKVANPSNHLSVLGNFVGSLLGASMGLKEGPIFFFAVGLAHYIVLFVTLYQRLPTNETLPKELHPVFFLFVAAPNVASMAWANIQGSFGFGSRIAYFVGLFLYASLGVRINFFTGFNFSLSWWAYTSPMASAAIATMKYSTEVTNVFTRTLSIVLTGISTLVVLSLLVITILHAFVLRDLFPNDKAIAISDKRPIQNKLWSHLRNGSSDANDIEQYLKFVNSAGNSAEVVPEPHRPDVKGV